MAYDRRAVVAWGAGVLLVLLVVWAGWSWMQHVYETPVVNIEAAYDVPELGLPVFAQFIVTQRIVINEPALLTELVVPLYAPTESQWLRIDLKRGEDLIRRWRYQPNEFDKVVFAGLPIEPPLLIDGEFQVVFSAEHFSHNEQHRAPRLFVESSMSSYREGGYRIADNEKHGNISLQLIERKVNWEELVKQWDTEPFSIASRVLWIGLVLVASITLLRTIFLQYLSK